MLPKGLIKGLDKGRLRNFLVLFFLALAVPTAVLIWQGYSQLKWEAFHQYRIVAEEFTTRIDARLNEIINAADARSFADYAFLVVSGDPSANFVQRSPLSAYPVAADVPGVIGHFQVDAEGTFSTPLLPPAGTEAASLGIGENEYTDRLELARAIKEVLADNRLVQARLNVGARRRFAESLAVAKDDYSQQVFDQLNEPRQNARYFSDEDGTVGLEEEEGEAVEIRQRATSIGKVSDLKFDANLQQKSEQVERDDARNERSYDAPGRTKRKEQIALLESAQPAASEPLRNIPGPADLRISTFESEVDPFEFSLLDSGHFVLFRNVWRDGDRYIQGLLVDQEAFTTDVIGKRFLDTALSDMTNLIVAFQDDVIHRFGGHSRMSYPNVAEGLDGALLYRNRLTAPLNGLELIFGIERLPPGPGGTVLGWVTLVLAIVFAGGFFTLYRLGLSQINLARQQQDFVSAVSHELKTPLTSIRMYGEMLKEGWADEEKRQSYYEFIHDESERLSRLISNVLQLANITRNEPEFDLKPTGVGELMSITESKVTSQVERAGFSLKFKIANDVDQATIHVDEDCFAQIIINLVDNAIKFSRNADVKAIEINCKRTSDNRISFSVRDFGPGIPKDQMKKIFQLFYRSESELTRETVGTGIGLAIVKQLTLAMNGTVDLINVEPGAEFRLVFSVQA
ncbi:MAG: sensor histidine kinase [Woeseiaceae bacterium]